MAGTDAVYVVALHYIKVLKHMIHRSSATEDRVRVMAVHTLELGCLAIDVNYVFLDFEALEAEGETDMLTSA